MISIDDVDCGFNGLKGEGSIKIRGAVLMSNVNVPPVSKGFTIVAWTVFLSCLNSPISNVDPKPSVNVLTVGNSPTSLLPVIVRVGSNSDFATVISLSLIGESIFAILIS